jgi:hypothetical protein
MADPASNTPHAPDCPQPGFRYGATVRRNAATIANGSAGKVLMLCKNSRCPARRYV